MTNTREERVAHALAAHDWPECDLLDDKDFSEREREEYFSRAKAAIAAIEPSPDVWEAIERVAIADNTTQNQPLAPTDGGSNVTRD